jgi:hypothetical protein
MLVSLVISRADEDTGPAAPVTGDAAALLRQSQAAMLGLDSFQFQMSGPWEGRELTYRLAWQRPDSFRVVSPNMTAEYETGEEPVITDRGIAEAIAVGDRIYFRECGTEGEDCESWLEGVRENVYVPGIAGEALDPFWTFELLGMMSEAQIVGQEDVHGVSSLRIRGRADVMEAMTQSWRRAEEERGPIYWGEECTGSATEPSGETHEECHTETLGDFIAMLEESSAGQESNGAGPVDVLIGRDDKLLRRLEFPVLPGVEPTFGFFTFSRFDEVTVEAPK